MAHLNVEDGTGVTLANSYVGLAEAANYNSVRGNSAWDGAASDDLRAQALVRALDYIETRFGPVFRGQKEFINIALAAVGHFDIVAANMQNNDIVTIGTTVYKFVNAPSVAFDIDIGADAQGSAENFEAAINLTGTAGVTYGTGTTIHPDVSAMVHESGVGVPGLAITAKVKGAVGNGIVTTTDSIRGAWDTIVTTGGQDSGEQPLSFPRLSLVTRDGTKVLGIPQPLRHGQMEYALQALAASLWINPAIDPTGLRLIKNRRKVGPIETELEYAESQTIRMIKPIPAADGHIKLYTLATGGLIRG